jgi:hypothetical protein
MLLLSITGYYYMIIIKYRDMDKYYRERLMKKLHLILTISAAALLLLTSLSSVIGTKNVPSTQTVESPLFTVRTSRSVQTESDHSIHAQYLGKGVNSHLFKPLQPALNSALDRTVKLLNANPTFFAQFLNALCSNPRIIALLQEQGISMVQFKTHLNLLKNNPSLFIEEIRNVEPKLSAQQLQTPVPLQLNTSNPIGCVITAIVMIPIVLIIGLIVVVFTLRILQCLKLDEIMNTIMQQILQGLTPAGFNI